VPRRAERALLGGAHDQPVALLAVELRRHERPLALQPPAVQDHRQRAVGPLALDLVGAVIPDLDPPRPVLAARDVALERRVLERVILDVHGERALAGPQRHAARERPAAQDAVVLEAEVVVQPAGRVALDDEDRAAALAPPLGRERLRRLARVALGPVLLEVGHLLRQDAR